MSAYSRSVEPASLNCYKLYDLGDFSDDELVMFIVHDLVPTGSRVTTAR